jgi:hypothetical protein
LLRERVEGARKSPQMVYQAALSLRLISTTLPRFCRVGPAHVRWPRAPPRLRQCRAVPYFSRRVHNRRP